jgi:hypothetical protein
VKPADGASLPVRSGGFGKPLLAAYHLIYIICQCIKGISGYVPKAVELGDAVGRQLIWDTPDVLPT